MKGDIIGAKKLDMLELSELTCMGDDDGRQSPCTEQRQWNSHQFSEAMSVINKFLKRQSRKCKQCGSNNPKITKPTFGWFYVVSLLISC